MKSDQENLSQNQLILKPEVIFFDLDDTILNYTSIGEKIWKTICLRYAAQIDGIDADTLFKSILEASRWYWSDPVRHQKGRLNLQIARREPISIALAQIGIHSPNLINEIGDAFHLTREKAVKTFPKAISTLKHFKNRGIRLGLITNGSSELQRTKINRFKLNNLFDQVLIEGELGYGKPDERIFRHALNIFNIQSQQAWMIGDDLERDIEGAQRLHIYTIWVNHQDTGLPSSKTIKPDKIVRNISELIM
jgi:putative hydrolase of the HAD superfamily